MTVCSELGLAKARVMEEGRYKGFWSTNRNFIKLAHYQSQEWKRRQIKEEVR